MYFNHPSAYSFNSYYHPSRQVRDIPQSRSSITDRTTQPIPLSPFRVASVEPSLSPNLQAQRLQSELKMSESEFESEENRGDDEKGEQHQIEEPRDRSKSGEVGSMGIIGGLESTGSLDKGAIEIEEIYKHNDDLKDCNTQGSGKRKGDRALNRSSCGGGNGLVVIPPFSSFTSLSATLPFVVSSYYPHQRFNAHNQPQYQVDSLYSSVMFRPPYGYSSQSQAVPSPPMNANVSSRNSSDGGSSSNSSWGRLPAVVRRHSYIEPLSRLVHGQQYHGTGPLPQTPTKDKKVVSNSNTNSKSNRNSVSSVNTFGQGAEALHSLVSVSTRPSSVSKRPDSISSSIHSIGVDGYSNHAYESNINIPQSRHNSKARVSQVYPNDQDASALSFSSLGESSSMSIHASRSLPSPTSGVAFTATASLIHATEPPGEASRRNEVKKEGGGSGGAPRNPRHTQDTSSPSPTSPSSLHDSAAIENEIEALRCQIRKATLILTHVVQTQSVPSPSALLDVFQDMHTQKSRHSLSLSPSPSLMPGQEHLEHRDRHSKNGCSCALLQDNEEDGKFGKGRESAFLAACYCPDPWEFQSRVLRQIEFMQQDLQTLKQEILEIEKRATIYKRQEMLEKERARDKEWVELNERLRNALLAVEGGEDVESDYEVEFQKRGSDYIQGGSTLALQDRGGGAEPLDESTEAGGTSKDILSEARGEDRVVEEKKRDKGKGRLEVQDRRDNQGMQMTERKEDYSDAEKHGHDIVSRGVSWASDYPPVSADTNTGTTREE